MTSRTITTLGTLTGIALVVFIIEAQLPPLSPVPGIKMGLANIVSLFTLFWLGRKEAFLVLIGRILLGSLFTGSVMSFLYSLTGGVLSLGFVALFLPTFSRRAIWIPAMLSAMLHNLGQLAVAALVTGTTAVFAFWPVLALGGAVTGFFTGLVAQYLLRHKAFCHRDNATTQA